MANCLVTKLKAEVSNPDLPILETMQQFTLDAIEASGNLSMSDEQKLALNHFFYQIGAIDNNGIYAKLGGLYLPIICGDALAYALVDYKGSATKDITQKDVKFQSHGLVTVTGASANTVLLSDYDGSPAGLTVAGMFTEAFLAESPLSFAVFGFRANSADTPTKIMAAQSGSQDYIELFTKRATYSSKKAFNGFVGTIDGDSHTALFISDNSFESNAVVDVAGASAPASLAYVTLYWGKDIPLGIYAYGSKLTSSEEALLASAMKELTQAFVSPQE